MAKSSQVLFHGDFPSVSSTPGHQATDFQVLTIWRISASSQLMAGCHGMKMMIWSFPKSSFGQIKTIFGWIFRINMDDFILGYQRFWGFQRFWGTPIVGFTSNFEFHLWWDFMDISWEYHGGSTATTFKSWDITPITKLVYLLPYFSFFQLIFTPEYGLKYLRQGLWGPILGQMYTSQWDHPPIFPNPTYLEPPDLCEKRSSL